MPSERVFDAHLNAAAQPASATTATRPSIPKDTPPRSEVRTVNAPIPAEKLYETASPSVVTIFVENDSGKPTSLASGFIVDESNVPSGYTADPIVTSMAILKLAPDAKPTDYVVGYGLTNHHAIEAAAVGKVQFDDRIAGAIIDVIAEDPESDVAFFSFAIPKTKVLVPLVLSEAAAVKVGSTVYAIGSPEGQANTLSNGLVSAIRSDDPCGLQITAPISHGSSGGPLFNDRGEVIGITTAIHRSGQNLNFAVTVDAVRRVLTRPQIARPLWRGVSVSLEEDLLFERAFKVAQSEDTLSTFVGVLPQLKYGALLLGTGEAQRRVAELQAAASQISSASKRLLFDKFVSFTQGKVEANLFRDEVSQVEGDFARAERADRSPHFKRAVAAFTSVLADDRRFPPALSELYGCYVQAGKRPEALAAAKLLVSQVPYSADAVFNCALEQEGAGDIKGAIESLERVLDLDPYQQVAAQSLATNYLREEEYEQSIRWYQHAIALSESIPGANCSLEYFNLSIAYSNLRKYRAAHESLIKARDHAKQTGHTELFSECEKRIVALEPLIK